MEILKKNRGFTIVETVIVLVIIGILAISIYIKWPEPITSLQTQTALLANDIRYTQNLSMARNERCRIVFTSATTYVIQNSSGNPIPTPSNTNGIIGNRITIQTPTPYTLIFDGKGTPYNGTINPETKLTTELIITLQNITGQTQSIHITPETGRISL